MHYYNNDLILASTSLNNFYFQILEWQFLAKDYCYLAKDYYCINKQKNVYTKVGYLFKYLFAVLMIHNELWNNTNFDIKFE